MKRLTVSQQVQVLRGLNRVGSQQLGETIAGGYLFLAESDAEADQLAAALHADQLDPAAGREQFAFSLTPRGRAALDTHEGA